MSQTDLRRPSWPKRERTEPWVRSYISIKPITFGDFRHRCWSRTLSTFVYFYVSTDPCSLLLVSLCHFIDSETLLPTLRISLIPYNLFRDIYPLNLPFVHVFMSLVLTSLFQTLLEVGSTIRLTTSRKRRVSVRRFCPSPLIKKFTG